MFLTVVRIHPYINYGNGVWDNVPKPFSKIITKDLTTNTLLLFQIMDLL